MNESTLYFKRFSISFVSRALHFLFLSEFQVSESDEQNLHESLT